MTLGTGYGRATLRALAIWALVLSAGGLCTPSLAQADAAPKKPGSYPQSGEVLMQADNLVYDSDNSVVTATGHVEIAYDSRVMTADKVTYNQKSDEVTADGHVSLLEPSGEVAFADHLVLRNKMKDGVVQTLSILLTDKSRLAGHDAERTGGTITTLHRGVYSPCEICKEQGKTTPLWQIKAFRVIHNAKTKRIIYEDAYMEIFGVPVAYLPFFSHPDPTVKRQSGFLVPSIASSTDLGQEVTIPYYWAIKPNLDLTLAPRFTSEEGIVFQGQFRHRLTSGTYQVDATGTWPRKRTAGTPGEADFRGSFFSDGAFDIVPTWDWGFQTELVTDNTYLRKYGLSTQTDLTNKLYLEHYDGRDGFSTIGYYFRNLLPTTNRDNTPWVAPIMNFDHDFGSILGDGRLTSNTNMMVLGTPAGLDSRRLSTSFNWEKQVTSRAGQVYRLFANVRGDVYATDKAPIATTPTTYYGNETVARALPQAGVEVSYPFVNGGEGVRQVIEPIAEVIAAPHINNTDKIPNQDSTDFEFDDTNLFSENRFPGYDLWESGSRASAGMRYSVYGNDGGKASVLFGQSYRLQDDTSFSAASGLRDQKSDYVGSIQVAPNDNFLVVHRFRLDKDNFQFKRNEIDLISRLGPLATQLGYAYYAQDPTLTATAKAREEVSLNGILKLSEFWRLFGSSTRDLTQRITISNRIGIGYQDECFGLSVGFYQSNIYYQDIEKSNTFLVEITFKNLGTAGTGARSGAATAGVINPGSSLFGNKDTSLFGDPADWINRGSH